MKHETYNMKQDEKLKSFHEKLKQKMDEYVHFVYKITKDFPSEEKFGVVSQLRRATLSVILNYIEGFARQRKKENKRFLETSYASLKESKYLLHFSLVEKYLPEEDYKKAIEMAEEIGAMLWKTIISLSN